MAADRRRALGRMDSGSGSDQFRHSDWARFRGGCCLSFGEDGGDNNERGDCFDASARLGITLHHGRHATWITDTMDTSRNRRHKTPKTTGTSDLDSKLDLDTAMNDLNHLASGQAHRHKEEAHQTDIRTKTNLGSTTTVPTWTSTIPVTSVRSVCGDSTFCGTSSGTLPSTWTR